MIAMSSERPVDPRLLARKRVGLSDALHGANKPDHAARWTALGVAAVLHAGLFTAAARLPAQREAPLSITQVELAPPPAPAPEPSPPEPEAPQKVAPGSPAIPAPAAAQVARAGKVLTARSDTPAGATDAVDFVTDPYGNSFGSGVVARGGTLSHGAAPVPLAPPRVRGGGGPVGGDDVTPAENLSRAARLAEPNPCNGSYPRAASADSGQVTLALVVKASGELGSMVVLSESPPGDGFGAAARACLAKKVFTPAMDKQGKPVTASLSLRIKFTR